MWAAIEARLAELAGELAGVEQALAAAERQMHDLRAAAIAKREVMRELNNLLENALPTDIKPSEEDHAILGDEAPPQLKRTFSPGEDGQ